MPVTRLASLTALRLSNEANPTPSNFNFLTDQGTPMMMGIMPPPVAHTATRGLVASRNPSLALLVDLPVH